MKQSLISVVLFVALLGSIAPVVLAPAAYAQEEIYQDPSGLFSAPIPTNWKAESKPGYALFTDPDQAIKVYIVPVDGISASQAITDAWQIAEPGFSVPVKDNISVPAANGIDELVQTTYVTPDTRIVLAVARRLAGKVYVTLVDAGADSAAKRNSQIAIIASGLTITAQKKTNLSGLKPKPVDAAMTAELDKYVKDALPRTGVPGATLAIIQDGRVVYTQAYGVKEMGKTDPMLPTTRMMIGSTGKTLTTLMMASIVDSGKMTWDQTAISILPSFAVADPELTKQITMRNLVCACTGVPRRDLELIFNGASLTPAKAVESLKTFQFFTKIGEAFQYSNQMVGAGGYIASIAGGGNPNDLFASYAAQLQARVLDPIGMPHTTLSFDAVTASQDYATPHGLTLLGDRVPIPLSEERMLLPVAPAGAHWSTVEDMARYVATLMNDGVTPDGRRVVSDKNLKILWEPQVAIDAENSYGLGWIVGAYQGLRLIQHGGNTLGFTSELAFLPDVKLGMVLLANGQAANLFTGAVRARLFELAFDQANGQAEKNFAFALDYTKKSLDEFKPQLQPLDAAEIDPFLGAYSNAALGSVTLLMKDGKLILQTGAFTTELRKKQDKEGKVTYVTYDPPLAGLGFELVKTDAGQPTLVVKWPPDTYTFVKG